MTADLIQKLEAAEGPDRELDEAIALAIGRNPTITIGDGLITEERHIPRNVPQYTASLDAAVGLVPEGIAGTELEFHDGYAEAMIIVRLPDGPFHRGEAQTPALALCIAALKAREQQDG